MKKNKITSKQLAFYKLYSEFRKDPDRYVNAWEFVGEIHLSEINVWGLMSYSCPRRVIEIMNENPRLLERRMTTGKSGSRYYQYRFRQGVQPDDVVEESIKQIYTRIRNAIARALPPKEE